ncbi:MAG: hypothetical protein EWM73_01942 [Nitrospira sp.]|nr:MAG: hypothetical protein EWM73_01942 [Nitrospira sp.]
MRSFKHVWFANLAVQIVAAILSLLSVGIAAAEMRTINATGEYRMGDNDTRADAKRLALLDAKRLALEQAGTYIESITQVKNFELSNEEIHAYTAGIVEVVEQTTTDSMEGSTHVLRVDVTARIDADDVTRQIDALRQSRIARAELNLAREESERLRQELGAKTRELAALKSKPEIEAIRQQRQSVMTSTDVKELLSRAFAYFVKSQDEFAAGSDSFKEDQTRARILTEQALRLGNSSVGGRFLMGLILYQEGKHADAVREYRLALGLSPDIRPDIAVMLHISIGNALFATGDMGAAITEFLTALDLDTDHDFGRNGFVGALLAMGDFDLAVKEEAKSKHFVSLVVSGKVNEHEIRALLVPRQVEFQSPNAISRLNELVRVYERTLRGDPRDIFTRYLLANAFLHKKDLDRAMQEFQAVLRSFPNHIAARMGVGVVQMANGDLKGARAEFETALALKPDVAEVHALLGETLQASGDLEGAISKFRQALRIEPDNRSALVGIIGGLARLGDWKGAVPFGRRLALLDPGNPNYHSLLGVALHGDQDWFAAAGEFREALRLEPNNAEAHDGLGRALTAIGDLDAAVAAHKSAVRLSPGTPRFHFNFAVAFGKAKRYRESATELREYLRLVRPSPETVGDIEAAKYLLDKAEKLGASERRSSPGCATSVDARSNNYAQAYVPMDAAMIPLMGSPLVLVVRGWLKRAAAGKTSKHSRRESSH